MNSKFNLNKVISVFKYLPIFTFGYYCYKKQNKVLFAKFKDNSKETFSLDKEYFKQLDFSQYKLNNSSNKNVKVLNTKSIEYLLGIIRDKTTDIVTFRTVSKRLIRLIIEEAISEECDKEVIRESPIGKYNTIAMSKNFKDDYIAVSILRSGNSMIDELMEIIPEISVGNVLVQRDEKTELKTPIYFFDKLPAELKNKKVFLVDPLLATGGSALAVINILVNKGIKSEDIVFLNIISCEIGLNAIFKEYPHIKVITASIDPVLMPNKYIAPGIGDFGDRFYGTNYKSI